MSASSFFTLIVKKSLLLLFIPLFFFTNPSFSQEVVKPPEFYIQKEACPFEGCEFKEWLTGIKTPVYTTPDKSSLVLHYLNPSDTVQAITGEIHVKPVTFIVMKNYKKYKKGDELQVYNYVGEGYFNIWHNGKMYWEDIGFTPYGDGMHCDMGKWYCYGEIQGDYKYEWWVFIKAKNNISGWVLEDGQFAGTSRYE